jgi:hypothetical protein
MLGENPKRRRPELRDGSVAVDAPGADADLSPNSMMSANVNVSADAVGRQVSGE